MSKATGFMDFERETPTRRPVKERLGDYRELEGKLDADALNRQAARCMDCGVPFCHNGCPLGNTIPEFNDLVYNHEWREAISVLHETNNFPEFTGRVCPAPCEESFVVNINSDPVNNPNQNTTCPDGVLLFGSITDLDPQVIFNAAVPPACGGGGSVPKNSLTRLS